MRSNLRSHKSNKCMRRMLAFILGWLFSVQLFAVELLSEGALDSVSAVAGESAEEILNAIGAPSAGLDIDDGFEVLPFRARIEVSPDDLDSVAEALDFAFTEEVEDWVSDIRQRIGKTFEIGMRDRLPLDEVSSNFNADALLDQEGGQVEFFKGGQDEDDLSSYQSSKIEQTLRLVDLGVDTIEYRFERYIELTATVDADPFDQGRTIGSGYISKLRSSGSVTLTRVRD